MNKKTIFITTGIAAAALVLGGMTVAIADPFDDDRDSDFRGSQVDQRDGDDQSNDNDRRDVSDDRDVSSAGIAENTPISDTDREQAGAAALDEVGSGTVGEVERSDDSDHEWDVEVLLADGTDVDVELDVDFGVTRIES